MPTGLADLALRVLMVKIARMLSAIILVPCSTGKAPPVGSVLRTLAALVPPTVEGTIRDVTLLDIGHSDDAARIADVAGCGLVQADDFSIGFDRCVAGARAPWVCILKAGTVPGATFSEDVAAALGSAGEPHAWLLRAGSGSLARYFPALSTVAGVIAPKVRLADRICGSFDDIVRRVRPARSLAGRVAVAG